jgi:hypothetical protein
MGSFYKTNCFLGPNESGHSVGRPCCVGVLEDALTGLQGCGSGGNWTKVVPGSVNWDKLFG